MKKFLLVFLLFFIGFLTNSIKASHLLGSDLSYECLGPGQYRVTLTLYRDCNGITPANSQTVSYSSATCGVNSSINLGLLNPPVDITPNCPSVPSACGGSGNYGIQQWTYTGILNLPPGCGADWILGFSQCCRNAAINTLNGASNQDMYVGANLNNTITPICNSSPVFNNTPGPIVCVNQPVVYNHGASDVDGDSLYYSLGNCFQSQGGSVAYNGGFNGTTPLTTAAGVNINPVTGAISFTPTAQQVGVLCVNVEEYRNGVLIGEINRDMQFTVIGCSNVPPQASGVNGLPNSNPVNFSTSICANGNLCFNINGTDPNGNNVTMSWNQEIPGATFTVANNGTPTPLAQFCWNPGPGDIGQNVFTVNVEDDACPIIGQGTYTYIIDVLPSPNILDAGPNDTICFGGSTTLTASSTPAALSYTWTPSLTLSSSTGASVVASPLNSTTYEVSASFPDGCNLTDNVYVLVVQNPSLTVNPSNSFNCSGQNNDLVATGISNIGGTLTYNWTPGNLPGPNVTVAPLVTTTYTVTATDFLGCSSTQNAVITIAAPTGNVCNVLYVTPTGSPSGIGSKADPMDLETAMEVGACNGTIIKMAIGDYITDTTINKVTSYLTLEGGFDPALNWDKISAAGATRILRTATQSYSTVSGSIVIGSGIVNETGANPEIIAMSVSNQSGFRFQDITIETQLNSPGTTMAGYQGPDVIGVELNTCDNYNIVRSQIIADAGGNGSDQIWSILATNGGDSRGLEINTNGGGGNIINSSVLAGAGGTGGVGTPNGTAGASSNQTLTGTALVTNNNNFNLAAQPVIRMEDVSCTETLTDFTQAVSGNWTFGLGSAPPSATGTTVTTQYSTLGRKNIGYAANTYIGFANIILDAQVLPTFTLSAPFVNGQYRVCAGSSVDFSATNGGVGYIYNWDMGGGAIPNTYVGVNFENLNSITFNTPGIYPITLRFETNCCGLSIPTVINLYVEEYPNLSLIASDTNLCFGANTPINIQVEDNIGFGIISWSPSAGLDNASAFTVNALPGSTVNYIATVTDSTGLCSELIGTTINVRDINLSTSVVNTTCGPNGSASVVATNGSGNYQYQWNDTTNQTTATATNLAVGVYTVWVTDLDYGCIDSATVVVNPGPGALVGFISNVTPVTCVGDGNGSATVGIVGGQAPFDYEWTPLGGTTFNTNATSNTTSLLSGGTYSVLITDANNCTYSVNAFIAEPDSFTLEIDTFNNPTCIGATNGFITIFADGGNAPLSIVWDNGQTGLTAINLGVGTYCAAVIDDSGCSDTVCFTLTAPLLSDSIFDTICQGESYLLPSGIVITPASDTISIDSLITAIGCDSVVSTFIVVNPIFNQTIDTTICIGDSYLSPSGISLSPLVDTSFIDSLLTINNCDSLFTINITVLDFTPINIDTTICQGQSITVNGIIYAASGSYSDTIFFANGCIDTLYTINLLVAALPTVTANTTDLDSAACVNQTLSVFGGGSPGLSFAWNNGISNNVAFSPTLGVTSYIVTGTDANNCVNSDTISIEGFPTFAQTIDTIICVGDSYTTPSGIILNPTIDTSLIDVLPSVNNCDSSFTINISVLNLTPIIIDTTLCQGQSITVNGVVYATTGNFSDTTFYANGCIDTLFTINILAAPLPTVSANTLDPDSAVCVNQSLTLFGGGSPGLTFTWNNGITNNTAFSPPLGITTYIVTGTDVNNCSNTDSIDIEGIPIYTQTVNASICEDENYVLPNGNLVNVAGSYPVTLTSSQSCDSTITTVLTVNQIGTFTPLEDISVCNGFSQTIEIVSANMTSFEWFVNEGSGAVSLLGNPDYLGANTSSLNFNLDTSLHQNIYSVVMIDECGNSYTSNMTLSVYEPHPVLNPVADTTFCFHEISAITVDYNGFDYVWSTGQVGQTIIPDFTGEYIVEFTENITNCELSDTINVTLEDCIGNCVVLAPTGFSPDASGANDIFRVVTTCDEGFSYFLFNVYNRWGELIYTTDDWRSGWDGFYKGRPAEIGTYTYFVEYTKELTNTKEMIKGNVTLIR